MKKLKITQFEEDVIAKKKKVVTMKEELMSLLKERRFVVNETVGPNAEEAIVHLKSMDKDIKELLFWTEVDPREDWKNQEIDSKTYQPDIVALEAERRRKMAKEYN